jgi:transcriptional regulator GlxA family with amidase domain
VSRLFRKQPRSVPEWIWQERLEACRRSLVDPRLATNTVGEIAYSWGFKDAAHFSRRFRQAYGIAPRDYRRERMP